MSDRLPIRDRTLILRIQVPGLEARLRDKMKEMEDRASEQQGSSGGTGNNNITSGVNRGGGGSNANNNNNNSTGGSSGGEKEIYLDLEGVTCEPTSARNCTLWNFFCDGQMYPAKLVNLPCPIEVAKTHDHAAYYKCADVAQMLIVYEDDMALEEAEERPVEGFPSYYPSGITPPMRRVVERRFAAREHNPVAPPRTAVSDVEVELTELMEKLAKDEKNKRKNKLPTLTSVTKVLEEVQEEIVDYEPWMDDYGRSPQGLEFDADDQICSLHPEVWLSPETIQQTREDDLAERKKKQQELEEREAKKRQEKEKKQTKKKGKKNTNKSNQKNDIPNDQPSTSTKKGIASKKNRENAMSEIDQIAASMLHGDAGGLDLMGDALEDDDLFGDLDLENDAAMDFGDLDLAGM